MSFASSLFIVCMSSLLFLSIAASAWANAATEKAAPAVTQVRDDRPAQAMTSPAVTVIPGPDGGRIEFTIKGKPVAIIDATGLHVLKDINYGGLLTDYGPVGLDNRATPKHEGVDNGE